MSPRRRRTVTLNMTKRNEEAIERRCQDKDLFGPIISIVHAVVRYYSFRRPSRALCIFGAAQTDKIHYVSPCIRVISSYPAAQRTRARAKSERSNRAPGILWEPLKVNSPRISFRVVPTDIPSRAARNCAAVRNRIGVSLAKRVYRGERDSRGARIRSTNRNSSGNTKVGHSPSFRPMRATTANGREGKIRKERAREREKKREGGLRAFLSISPSESCQSFKWMSRSPCQKQGGKND